MRARPNEDFVSDARHDVRAYDEVLNHLGEADSRRLIPTPALVCDRSILLANIEVMARLARDAGLALRPHVKTHKSAYVAKRQLEAGAVAADTTVSVLCDVDVGLGRTGVTGPGEALEVAERVNVATGLQFRGVQGYGGHLQHIAGRERRREATIASTQRLAIVIEALESAGFNVAIRSGGGTGTTGLDVEIGVLNELQSGSYVFMDREYRDALGEDPEGRFAQSLTLITTVISANHEGYVTVDAGLKSMATDAGVPVVAGHERAATYAFFGDEQGMVTCAPDSPFRRGERLELVPPHCDPTVDRHDVIWLVLDDVVLDVIEVTARGRSQ